MCKFQKGDMLVKNVRPDQQEFRNLANRNGISQQTLAKAIFSNFINGDMEKIQDACSEGKKFYLDSPDSDRRAFFKFGGTTYFITRDGKVLSSRGDGHCDRYELHEIAQYNGKGYRRVRLRGKTFKVHRLVAEAFLPNPNNLPYVLHIDGNRENNIYRNLEWSNRQSNHPLVKGQFIVHSS